MSDNHCWYVIGRNLRLAITYAVFASLFVVNPAFAVEDTDFTAQKAAETTTAAKAIPIAETDEPPGLSEGAIATKSTTQGVAGEGSLNSITQSAVSEQFALPSSDEVFDLVLTVRRRNKVLSDTTLGLQKGFQSYLPMQELARLINFPHQIDLENQRFTGYIFSQDNGFILDVGQGTYSVLGKTLPLPQDSVIVKDFGQGIGEFYATPELLNELWSLGINVDFSKQAILITTPRRTPSELEAERKERQAELENENNRADIEQNFDTVHNGYRLLGPQTLNINNNLFWDNSSKTLRNSTNFNGRGDLLGAEASYTINVENGGEDDFDLEQSRVLFTRRNLDNSTFLPYGLNLVQVGDVSARTPLLTENIISGRGVFLSTKTNSRPRTFDEVVIEGISQPGWEVELYRGGQLLDFVVVNQRGEYQFENVQLSFGKNRFRLVFYGTEGQIEERFEEYDIDRRRLRPGQTQYEVGILDNAETLIDVTEGDIAEEQQGLAYTGRIDRGFAHWLTGFATVTRTPTTAGDQNYLTVGANFNTKTGTGQIEAYKQLGGGEALDVRYATRFAGFRTNFRTSFFKDFESQEAGFGDETDEFIGEFRANRNFSLPFGIAGLDFNGFYTKNENGTDIGTLQAIQSLDAGRVNVSNTLTNTFINGEQTSAAGQFNVGTPITRNLNIQSELGYSYDPSLAFDAATLRLRYLSDDRKISGSFSANQDLDDSSRTNIVARGSYDFGQFTSGLDFLWDRGEGLDVVWRTSTTLGPQGENNIYGLSSTSQQQPASLEARVYHDIDGDGAFGEQDQPIEGARLILNGGRTSPFSDAEGYIDFPRAGPTGLAVLTYDRERSPDPFLTSVKDGVRTVLRPGTKPFINFPLIATGGIDGIVRFADGRPIPGVIVQLIDQHGNLAAESPTLSDGFYSFEFVRPGRYIVALHPSHPIFVPTQTVTVASDDLFAYGVDLQVLEQAEEASVAESGGSGRVAHTYHKAPAAGGTELPVSTSSDDGVQPVVRAVRVGEYPDKTRLVLDLSEPISYQVTQEKNGSTIYIELPNTRTESSNVEWSAGRDTLFSNIDIQPLQAGGIQIRLDAEAAPLTILKSALLPAANGLDDRLYIDFTNTNN